MDVTAIQIFGFTIVDMVLCLLAARLGRDALLIFIVANLLALNLATGKTIEFFGLTTTAGTPFYAVIFLATDVLSEHFGKRESYRAVWLGLLALFVFIAILQLAVVFPELQPTKEISDALTTISRISLRVFLASIAAYLSSQLFDIWLYSKIKSATDGKLLWLRNNVSTMLSQIIDSAVFFSCAFIGVLDNWFELIWVGLLLKFAIASLDTPFLYISGKIVTKHTS